MHRTFTTLSACILSACLLFPRVGFTAPLPETTPSLASCISSATPSLQLDLRDAQADYNAHIQSEWERQLGFRLRAAQNSATRLSRERALSNSSRRLTQTLGQAGERVARADQDELRGFAAIYNSDSDERLQVWVKRAVNLGNLTQVLNSLRTDLHRYANATDRTIITRIWTEKRAEFLETLNSDRADARMRFYDRVENCLAGIVTDDEEEPLLEDDELFVGDPGLGDGTISLGAPIRVQATASVFPLSSQACNQVFDYTGTITVDGPTTVKYRWEAIGSPVETSSIETLTFTEAGTKQVVTSWIPRPRNARENWRGWQKLHILSPIDISSNQAEFNLTCLNPNPDDQTLTFSSEVRSATLQANPDYMTSCQQRVNFQGLINMHGSGTVKYYWERSDGIRSPTLSLASSGTGMKPVEYSWNLEGGYSGWVRYHIISPTNYGSNEAYFKIDCRTRSATPSYTPGQVVPREEGVPPISPPTSTTPPPVISTERPLQVAGHWYHNFGQVTLRQNGSTVEGTYSNSLYNAIGAINGTLRGNVLSGTYDSAAGSGAFTWTFSEDGKTFNGTFANTAQWCGARDDVPFRKGCSFSDTSWRISLPAVCDNMTMDLTRTNDTVTGTYCGNRRVTGQVTYSTSSAILTGTWTMESSNGPFAFYLPGYSGTQIQGNYNQSFAWCAARSGSELPTTCLR